jgi:hypothetical protein
VSVGQTTGHDGDSALVGRAGIAHKGAAKEAPLLEKASGSSGSD